MITKEFSRSLIVRIFGGGMTWSNFKVGLGRTPVSQLHSMSFIDDVGEIEDVGYARCDVSTITVDLNEEDTPVASFNLPGTVFENTGSEDWVGIQNVFLVGTLGGVVRLCGVWSLPSWSLPVSETAELPAITIPFKTRE